MSFALGVVWLHVLTVAVWIGGLAYQTHVLLPAARRFLATSESVTISPQLGARTPGIGGSGAQRATPEVVAEALRRGRWVTWPAVCLVVLTGLYNVTQLGPLERVMESGAGALLAAKFFLVLVMIAVAAHRDFARLPALAPAAGANAQGHVGRDSPAALRVIVRLDRIVLLLAAVVIYLGVAVSRLTR
jgi:uncharacterized membrane protein